MLEQTHWFGIQRRSADARGLDWTYHGHPYYSRTNGTPWNSATDGSQAMVSLGGNKLYVVFYAADSESPGRDRIYIDGCLLEL
jgi:hypothetical protein